MKKLELFLALLAKVRPITSYSFSTVYQPWYPNVHLTLQNVIFGPLRKIQHLTCLHRIKHVLTLEDYKEYVALNLVWYRGRYMLSFFQKLHFFQLFLPWSFHVGYLRVWAEP